MKRHASMNRIYRLVWSQVAHTWIAVAENAKGHGKSISGRKLMAAALTLLSPMALSSLAEAAPSGGQIVSGAGSIAQSGAVTTINQTSQNLSLNWQGFNVGAQETVNFVQPSASAIAVNRIFDTNGSQILGNLNANGQVYLINPNGVLFGAGAQVNVGGLVASTLGFDDADLGGAARSFAGAGAGSVVNQGNIRGGYVALIGNSVSNTGSITANSGTAALGAGSAVTLTFAGNSLVKMQVDQSTLNNQAANGGLIRADGGTVLMSAGAKNALLASVVNNTGVIEARSVQNVNGTIVLDGGNIGSVNNSGTLDAAGLAAGETGGTVKVLGGTVALAAGSNIDVSGDAGGGTALIGGNYQGKGPEQNASDTTIAAGATLNADALTRGDGGMIVAWSDKHTTVDGSFSARGGASSGNGGQIETSGKQLTIGDGIRVDTLAPKGQAGNWLLDPVNFTIYGVAETGDMLDTTLNTALASGSVTIQTGGSMSCTGIACGAGSAGNGDIFVTNNAFISWTTNTLTLSAYRNIDLVSTTAGASFDVSGGAGNLVLRSDNTGIGSGTVNIGTQVWIDTSGGGSTTIYYNPASYADNVPTVYKADATYRFGTFNVKQLVRVNNVSPAVTKTYDGATTITSAPTFSLVGTPTGASLNVGSASFSDKNVGTGKAINYSGYTAGGTNTDGLGFTYGYELATQPTATGTITQKALTVTGASVNNKTYDTTTTATLASGGTLSGFVGVETVLVSGGSGTFADKNVGTGKAVTVTGVTLADGTNGGLASNYSVTNPVGLTANITKADLAVTGVTVGNKTYDASTAATLGGTAAVTALGGDTVSVGGTGSGTFANKNVGTGKAVTVTGYTLSGTDAGNYNIVQPTGLTANITSASLSVTGIVADSRVYDGTTTATLSGTPVVFAFGGDTVTVGGTGSGTFANKNVGTAKAVTITGYTLGGADAGNYTIVQPGGTANITAKALTATITAVNKTYDGNTTATPTFTITGGLVGTETVTASGAATFADKNAGVGKTVTANSVTLADGTNGGLASNYSLTTGQTTTANIDQKALTATITAVNKTYDGNTTATPTFTITGGLVGAETVTASGAATFADKNAGVGKTVTANSVTLADGTFGGLASNYSLTTGQTTTANIDPKALTITGMTASNKTYNGTTAATLSGGTLSGFVGLETVTASGGTGTFADKNAGTGKAVTVSGVTLADGTNGGLAANYSVTNPIGLTANITAKAMSVSGITAANKTYDGTTSATANAAGAVFTGLVGGDTVTVSATGAFADKNVANGKTVTLASSYGGADAGNYAITDQASTTANITPKAMSVSGITASNKVYDGTTAATTNTAGAVLTGLVGGDTVNVSATGTFADKNVANGKTVTLASSYGGADAGNYTITDQASTTANITQKALTLGGITASNKVYDGTTAATLNTASVTFSGLVGADVVTLGGAGSGAFADKNVANGKTVTVSGYTLGGADAANYSVGQPTGLTANITAKAMSVSGITAANKTYDGTTSATANAAGAVFTGLVGGDTVTVSATGAFADKNVANGKTVTLASSYGGADAGNYAITDQASTTANITPKAMSVSGITAGNKVYDGTTAATTNTVGAVLTGLVGGDTVNVSATGTFADKNVANGKTVTLASSYGGADAGNYTITDQASTTANISAASLAVTGVTASNKTYDGTTAATLGGVAAVSALGSDTVTVGGTGSGTFADKNVGTGKAVTVSGYTLGGADAGNYTVVQPTGLTANITAKAMTLSGITAANKTYDGTTSATVNSAGAVFTGLVGGDTVTVSATGAFADKNVANGKTVTLASSYGGADAGNYAITDQASTTANITPKAMSVSGITASNKVYDGTTAATTNTAGAVLTGLVGGDTVNVSATGTFADKNVANGKTVTLASSYGGADAGNYTITDQASTTANISAASLAVIGVTASNKTYDGTTAATLGGVAAVSALGSDTVTVGGTGSGTFADKNVGTGKAVTVSGYTLGGADAGNYTVVQPTGLTANITAKAMTLSGITAANKTYDGTTSATANAAGAVFTGLVGGDTVTVSATGAFADKNVANGKTVTLASSYGGADAGNYAITDQASTTANITPKAMSVSGITASNKVYDGTTAATTNTAGAVLTGLVGGDTVNVSATGTFADKNAGNGKTVTLVSTYGGADMANYAITDQASTTANITPKALTVAANADTKFQDGAAYAGGNGVTYAGLVAGETAAVLGGALTYGGTSQGATAAGSYSITPGGLTSGNYALNFVDGVLTINASAAPVEAQNAATQVISQVLAGSVVVSVSPTITVSRVAAPAKQDSPAQGGTSGNSAGNTAQNNMAQNNATENDGIENEQAESEHREVVNVAMNFNRGGPTLRIMNGGTRLPTRYGQQNE